MLISLLTIPNFSFAQSSTDNTEDNNQTQAEQKKETIRDRIETRKEEVKQDVASKTEAIKNSVQERKQTITDKMEEQVNKFTERLRERYDAAVNRLDVLTLRIESRIAKIKAVDIDVSEAEELLIDAKDKIATAKASIALIGTPETTTTDSTTSTDSSTVNALKNSFGETRAQVAKAKEDLKEAHAALVDVINGLKPGQNKLEKEMQANKAATTTATTTNE